MANETLATDAYSVTLAQLRDNPGALYGNGSTIDLVTFLRNSETWFVQVIRVEGKDHGFIQRIGAEGGQRWVLPPEVMAAIARQTSGLTDKARRRGARQAVATKLAAGKPLGNLAGLEAARKKRGRK